MDAIHFRTMTDDAHADGVTALMREFYVTDRDNPARFPRTVHYLLKEPSRGRIVLILEAEVLRGYAILVPYWSNEYGGNVLFVDEIFVTAEARGRGIGHEFFSYLVRERPFEAVALFLEVSPTNTQARRLYESLGFRARAHATLALPLVGAENG